MEKSYYKLILIWFLLISISQLFADNPVIKGIGLTDPHIVIFGDSAYMYATHDFSSANKTFVMKDWWVWSSADLIHWKLIGTLKPESTYLKKPFNDCWAGFCVNKNNKYYWYFSAGPKNIGVVVANSPVGPWNDPLGKALLPKGLVSTEQRDPDILTDDNGKSYMVFGTFKYYIVRLGDDMISLAETPKPVLLDRCFGPYGVGKTDDKPSLHKRNGIYYLSWSSFYAISPNIYGPYTYKGSVIVPENTTPEFKSDTTIKGDSNFLWKDRHGNFFTWHNQWFYTYNDASQPGASAHFRDANISYVHFRDNGEMAPIRIDRIGVGQYDAKSSIEAEDFFGSEGVIINESPDKGFMVRCLNDGCHILYPNVMNMPKKATLSFFVSSGNISGATIEVRENNKEGQLLGKCKISNTGGWDKYQKISCQIRNKKGKNNLCLLMKGYSGELIRLDWIKIN